MEGPVAAPAFLPRAESAESAPARDSGIGDAHALPAPPPEDEPLFDDLEWLAIFPTPPPTLLPPLGPPARGEALPDPDPAKNLRAEMPLDADALVRELSRVSPALGRLVRLSILLEPFTGRPSLRSMLYGIPAALFAVPPIVLNGSGGTTFANTQLVAGTVAMLFVVVAGQLFVTVLAGMRRQYQAAAKQGRTGPRGPADRSGSVVSGIARWSQLVARDAAAGGKGGNPRKRLLSHVAGDGYCPCPAESCAGGVVRYEAALRVLDMVLRMVVTMLPYCIGLEWTSLVTFGPAFFATWYGPPMLVFLLLGFMGYQCLNVIARPQFTLASLQLADRIQRRATAMSLRSLVDKYAANGAAPSADHCSTMEPYEIIHAQLSARWRQGLPFLTSGRDLIVYILLTSVLVPSVINLAAGSCLPMYVFLFLLFVAVYAGFDLVLVAATNSSIRGAAYLYKEARASLRRAARSMPPAAVQDAAHHDGILELFCDTDRYAVRWLGAAVTMGALRAVAISALTVAGVFYSLVRGSGISVTPNSICGG
ncbi:hypothetical protein DFJ74DRAFT_705140 [Hyaloraphidium curvatum]|nr:hypothetical protein DFJ74DRAFT_705140 [Hyaloraphidium curvatum]